MVSEYLQFVMGSMVFFFNKKTKLKLYTLCSFFENYTLGRRLHIRLLKATNLLLFSDCK